MFFLHSWFVGFICFLNEDKKTRQNHATITNTGPCSLIQCGQAHSRPENKQGSTTEHRDSRVFWESYRREGRFHPYSPPDRRAQGPFHGRELDRDVSPPVRYVRRSDARTALSRQNFFPIFSWPSHLTIHQRYHLCLYFSLLVFTWAKTTLQKLQCVHTAYREGTTE
jgi:hypothetical protein